MFLEYLISLRKASFFRLSNLLYETSPVWNSQKVGVCEIQTVGSELATSCVLCDPAQSVKLLTCFLTIVSSSIFFFFWKLGSAGAALDKGNPLFWVVSLPNLTEIDDEHDLHHKVFLKKVGDYDSKLFCSSKKWLSTKVLLVVCYKRHISSTKIQRKWHKIPTQPQECWNQNQPNRSYPMAASAPAPSIRWSGNYGDEKVYI